MLEKILKMYTTSMLGDVRSPLPHLVGPPGCGKSTSVEQAAQLLGVKLHIINVARLSPLEIEGVQFPVDTESSPKLHLLLSSLWNNLNEGDIVLLDEFLRGFPEVYNGLLDILTSRQVAGHVLPKVFIIAASNSVTTYDGALEDRLLHLPVDDIRKSKRARRALAEEIVGGIGLLPDMADSDEMNDLIITEIEPMYSLLDRFKGTSNRVSSSAQSGSSPRKLIGQARMREIQSPNLLSLLNFNNTLAAQRAKWQYIVLPAGSKVNPHWVNPMRDIRGHKSLTQLQALNLEINLQLVELEEAKSEKEGTDQYDDDILGA